MRALPSCSAARIALPLTALRWPLRRIGLARVESHTLRYSCHWACPSRCALQLSGARVRPPSCHLQARHHRRVRRAARAAAPLLLPASSRRSDRSPAGVATRGCERTMSASAAANTPQQAAHPSQHGGERALHQRTVALQQRQRRGVALRGSAPRALLQDICLLHESAPARRRHRRARQHLRVPRQLAATHAAANKAQRACCSSSARDTTTEAASLLRGAAQQRTHARFGRAAQRRAATARHRCGAASACGVASVLMAASCGRRQRARHEACASPPQRAREAQRRSRVYQETR
jgi:hypothetical protein